MTFWLLSNQDRTSLYLMDKFLLIIMVNSQLSTLGESNQYVAGPMRQAGDIQDVAPAFKVLTVRWVTREKSQE